MATPTEDELKIIQDLIDQIGEKYKTLGESSPYSSDKIRDLKAWASEWENGDAAINALNESLKHVNAEVRSAEIGLKGLKDIFKSILEESEGKTDILKDVNKNMNRLKGIMGSIEDLQYNIQDASENEIRTLKTKTNLEFNRIVRNKESLEDEIVTLAIKGGLEAEQFSDLNKNELEGLTKKSTLTKKENKKLTSLIELQHFAADQIEGKIGYQSKFNKALDITLKKVRNINKATGLTGSMIEGMGKMFSKIGFKDMSEEIHIANTKMKGLADEFTRGGKEAATFWQKVKIGAKGIGSLLGSIGRQLRDPLVVFGLIAKAFKELLNLGMAFAKETADIGAAFLGWGKSAENVAMQLREGASGTKGMFISIEEAHKAMIGLNSVASTHVKFSEESRKTYKEIAYDLGLGEEAAQQMFVLSLQSGVAYEDVASQIGGVLKGLNLSNKTSMNWSVLMKDILKSSSAVKLNLGNSVPALAEASFYARRLGMSIDEIKSASETLLDFETSISNELQTELLIGRDINLEKLRYYTLIGRTDKAAAEMHKILLKNKDAIKGNVILQRSFAQMLGLSTDQLMKSVEQAQLHEEIGKRGYGEKDRVAAQREINHLMSQHYTKKEAFEKLADKGLKTIIHQREKSEEVMRLFQQAKETLQTALIPLAMKVVNKLHQLMTSKSVKEFGKSLASGLEWIIDLVKGMSGRSWALIATGLAYMAIKGSTPLTPMWVALSPLFGGAAMLGMGAAGKGGMFATMTKFVKGVGTKIAGWGAKIAGVVGMGALATKSISKSATKTATDIASKTATKIASKSAVSSAVIAGSYIKGGQKMLVHGPKIPIAKSTGLPDARYGPKPTPTGSSGLSGLGKGLGKVGKTLMKGMGVGAIVSIAGDLISSQMKQSESESTREAGKVVDVASSVVGYASMGAMLGAFAGPLAPIASGVLGTAGAIYGLWDAYDRNYNEQKEQNDKMTEETRRSAKAIVAAVNENTEAAKVKKVTLDQYGLMTEVSYEYRALGG